MDERAERLAIEHRPLVYALARKLYGRLPPDGHGGVSLDDLEGDGMEGLLDAARRFKEGTGATFSTFATTRVWGAMVDGLRRADFLSRSARARGVHVEISSLETPIADDLTLADMLADPAEPEERADRRLQIREGLAAIAALPPRERFVFVQHDLLDQTLSSIGAELGVTESRVSQICTRARHRLRRRLQAAAA